MSDPLTNPISFIPPSRVIHLRNLPSKCGWEEISDHLNGYDVEQHHIFGNQALIQFISSNDALNFLENSKGILKIKDFQIQVQLSNFPILNSSSEALFSGRVAPSPVVCIQLLHLKIFMSIFDIYDECSRFGTVLKIICFEKIDDKFALVQMNSIQEAALVLSNLHNNPRHLPNFQMHIQYSKNQELSVKSNSSRSFDFLISGSKDQFLKLRNLSETPFFSPENNKFVNDLFNIWSPVHFDPVYPQVLCVTNLDEARSACTPLRNLFSQYGHVSRVKVLFKNRRTAFIQMSTSFFSRLASFFLHNCPFMGRKLQISFSSHVDVIPSNEPGSEDLFVDYGNGPIDLPIDHFNLLYFPSEYVYVKSNVKIDDLQYVLQLPNSSIIPEFNAIKFDSINEAVSFISAYNGIAFRGTNLLLCFMRPPSKKNL